jgi:hypothetical protein
VLGKPNLESLFVTIACVYFYPRYKAYRKSNKDMSRFRSVCDVVGISWPTTLTSGINSDSNLSEPLFDGGGSGDASNDII